MAWVTGCGAKAPAPGPGRLLLNPLPTPAGGSQTRKTRRWRKARYNGEEREGNKATLSPNLGLSSHSMLARSPDSPTCPLRSREAGGGGAGERGGGVWRGGESGRSLARSLASRPPLSASNLTINLSHIYLFFLKFLSLPHNEPPY